jgi:hypothetical protein
MTAAWRISGVPLWAAMVISACVPVEHPAQRVTIQTEIEFIDADGRPLADEAGYILEPLPFLEEITQTFNTDEDGKVRLDGTYCTPLIVAIDGGAIALRRDNDASSHSVTTNADRLPTKEAAYGQPRPGYTTLRRWQSYKACEQWSPQ